jgi:nuclear pore complex protein Nup98-Nup96
LFVGGGAIAPAPSPAFGGTPSTAFGVASSTAFGGAPSPAFGGTPSPAFGGTPSPAFGGASSTAFGGAPSHWVNPANTYPPGGASLQGPFGGHGGGTPQLQNSSYPAPAFNTMNFGRITSADDDEEG